MGLLFALGRGAACTAIIVLTFAILKRLIFLFGLFFALAKFVIVVAFLALFISIAVAMFRDWSEKKDHVNGA